MLRLEHRPTRFDQPHGGPELVEIVTPRTNAAALSAAEHLFAALVGSRGLALELAGDATGRRLYARTRRAGIPAPARSTRCRARCRSGTPG